MQFPVSSLSIFICLFDMSVCDTFTPYFRTEKPVCSKGRFLIALQTVLLNTGVLFTIIRVPLLQIPSACEILILYPSGTLLFKTDHKNS